LDKERASGKAGVGTSTSGIERRGMQCSGRSTSKGRLLSKCASGSYVAACQTKANPCGAALLAEFRVCCSAVDGLLKMRSVCMCFRTVALVGAS
jgi:hypothetical protein